MKNSSKALLFLVNVDVTCLVTWCTRLLEIHQMVPPILFVLSKPILLSFCLIKHFSVSSLLTLSFAKLARDL